MTFRRFVSSGSGFLLATFLLLAALPAQVAAQDQPADAKAASPRVPIVSFELRSLDRLIEVLTNLSEVSGVAESPPLLNRLQKVSDLPGLDSASRWTGRLFASETPEKPDLLLTIPVTDAAALLHALENVGAIQNVRHGESGWTIAADEQTFFCREQSGQLFVSTRQALLQLADLPQHLQHGQSDAWFQLDPDGLKESQRSAALQQFERDLDKEAQQKDSESETEFAIRRQAVDLLRQLGRHIFTGTESVSATVHCDRHLHLHAQWQAKHESELARDFRALPAKDIQVTRWKTTDDALLHLTLAIHVPEWFQHGLRKMASQVQHQVRQQIEQSGADAEAHPAMGLFDSVQATLQQGTLQATLALLPTPEGHQALVTSMRIVQGDALNAALEAVFPSENDRHTTLRLSAPFTGAAEQLHRLARQHVRPRDEQIYGTDSLVYLGAGTEELLFAIGRTGIEPLLNDRTSPGDPNPKLLQLDAALRPLLQLRRKTGPNFESRLERFFPADDPGDGLHFNVSAQGEALRLDLETESGILRWLGWKLFQREKP